MYKNVFVVEHPLVAHNLTILRDENSDCEKFNAALKRISYALFFEGTKFLPTVETPVKTPICETSGLKIDSEIEIIVAPILRAGLAFGDVAGEILPFAKVHHLGMYRNEETLEPIWYYNKLKGKLKNPLKTFVFVLDPMLATGNSGYDAVHNFVKQNVPVENIVFISLISAPEGIKRLNESYPELKIVTSKIDEKLNDKGYIVPGLGDAGDRIFNTLY